MGDYEDFILLKSLFDFFSQVGMFAICLHYKSLQISGQSAAVTNIRRS